MFVVLVEVVVVAAAAAAVVVVVVVVAVALSSSVLWYRSKDCEPPVHNVRKDTVICPSSFRWKSSL